jgi:hypothetical protein
MAARVSDERVQGDEEVTFRSAGLRVQPRMAHGTCERPLPPLATLSPPHRLPHVPSLDHAGSDHAVIALVLGTSGELVHGVLAGRFVVGFRRVD